MPLLLQNLRMEKPTLLVLAAGMATRYGSLKQLDLFGPRGETLIEYSLYDAIKAGFGKVVFIIRKSIKEAFKERIQSKLDNRIAVEYITQELSNLPSGFSVPKDRLKPWGTGHAAWIGASKIRTPFAVINADDFYGYGALQMIGNFLRTEAEDRLYGLVGYKLMNTLSSHGAVSRGICEMDNEGYLTSVNEQTQIVHDGNSISTGPHKAITLNGTETVSMNLMGFTPSVFPFFEQYFRTFLNNYDPEDLKAEFYLPEAVNMMVKDGTARVKVLPSSEKWFGVTFPGDKPHVIQKIRDLIKRGHYPKNLWASSPRTTNSN